MAKATFGRLEFGPRRGEYLDLATQLDAFPVPKDTIQAFEDYDLIYRALCGILYNFVPNSGHPGGSISSGRIVAALLFDTMDYCFGDPECLEADVLSYAAGHKAMGLYAMWALRNEMVRSARPDLLPAEKHQLRLEDLLGFRRNPTQETPLFKKYRAKALDGHPTPMTPHIKLATGASGVGVPSSFGLGFGAMDTFGAKAPLVHVLEGEGGMTAGRVSESLATAATAQLWNLKLHLDWNQSSIDSDRVCREGERVGDYVQWDPVEFCYLHDWNTIRVPDGKDFRQVLAAQAIAKEKLNDQPTAVIYRTIKGWRYGIEGRKSHGGGHGYLSPEFYKTLEPMEQRFGMKFPHLEVADKSPNGVEQVFFDTLMAVRKTVEDNRGLASFFADRLVQAEQRMQALARTPRPKVPNLGVIYTDAVAPAAIPPSCTYAPGKGVTLRGALGDALGHLNELSGGGIVGAAADLLDSTSISNLGKSFPKGYYNAVSNPEARLLSIGGICEDAMGAFMTGVAAYGNHIGSASSYAAFIAALEHIAARLHGIGQMARREHLGEPFRTFILVCAHAGLKTGEDGPTHADPQPLQLLQENFPPGVMITLTPWDPQELYPMLVTALHRRPAVIAPFVTRPNETIVDRASAGLPPVTAAVDGLYAMRRTEPKARPYHGTLVLQGSGVANTFVQEVLPRIDKAGLNLNVFYVSSAELFDLLPAARRQRIFPDQRATEAMGITGFTLPTMYRWITSPEGRRRTRHAFSIGHYLGSGQAHKVLEEAGLHGDGQWQAILSYARWMEKQKGAAVARSRKPVMKKAPVAKKPVKKAAARKKTSARAPVKKTAARKKAAAKRAARKKTGTRRR
jgi:transketolase